MSNSGVKLLLEELRFLRSENMSASRGDVEDLERQFLIHSYIYYRLHDSVLGGWSV